MNWIKRKLRNWLGVTNNTHNLTEAIKMLKMVTEELCKLKKENNL